MEPFSLQKGYHFFLTGINSNFGYRFPFLFVMFLSKLLSMDLLNVLCTLMVFDIALLLIKVFTSQSEKYNSGHAPGLCSLRSQGKVNALSVHSAAPEIREIRSTAPQCREIRQDRELSQSRNSVYYCACQLI